MGCDRGRTKKSCAAVVSAVVAMHPQGFSKRLLTAGAWLLGSNLASQALRLVSSLVLTRLLVPEAFGLVAAVQTMYFALVMFSDLGVWQSVVTSPRGNEPRFLGTAMGVQLIRAVVLALVVLVLAASLSHFAAYAKPGTVYADGRLPALVTAFALCALLQGAESMHLATAQRELNTKLLARLELLSQIAGMLVTIGLAFTTRSVWSLVAGTLTTTLARTVLSHRLLQGPAYRICWDKSCLVEIVGFGKWIFLSSIIGFAASNGEKLILGGTLSSAAFGTFSIAALLLAAISGLVGNLNAHLVFPGLSEALRASDAVAMRLYTRMQQGADAILGVIAGGTFVAGGWVVHLLYDSRYAGAAWMLQLLGLGLLAIRYQVLEQMMFAHGKPAWVTLSNALRATSLVIFVPLGYAGWGEHGAVIAVMASQFVGWPVSIAFKIRSHLMHWQSEVVWPISLATGMAAGWLLNQWLSNGSTSHAFHFFATQ
jgi:O-antigen/teichoic acid export membrane protein